MNEVRDEDVRVADAAVEVRPRSWRRHARLAALTVKSRGAGRIIKMHAHAGEQAGPDGILELANTSRMAVVAEVYATDIARVHPGQRRSSRSRAAGPRFRWVTRVGERVQQSSVLPGDPPPIATLTWCRSEFGVDGCARGACPINARVKVTIGGAQ